VVVPAGFGGVFYSLVVEVLDMLETHGVVCAGPRATDVADVVADAGVPVETASTPLEAAEGLLGDGCLVLAVDEGTDPSLLAAVRERAPTATVVVVVADAVDAALAKAAVDADVAAIATPDDDVPSVVANAVADAAAATDSAVAAAASVMNVDGDWRGHVVDRLFETSPDRLLVVGADGTVVRANDRARERFAISIGESSTGDVDVYDTDGEYVPPEARPWANVFRTGRASYGHQFRVDPDDRESSWHVVDVVPLGDGPDAAFVSFRDVTDDERARERLRERKEELAAELDETLERVTDAFFALDDDWRFTYVNDTAAELIDVDPEALQGESIWDAFPEAVGTTFEDRYRTAMRDQQPMAFEEYYPPLSTWFAVRAYPSDSGLSVYFQDVTDRKAREDALNERLTQQEVVSELSTEAIERADVDGFLRTATERVVETLDADGGRLLEYGDGDPAGDARVRASVGDGGGLEGTIQERTGEAGAGEADPDGDGSARAEAGTVATAEVGAGESPWGELVVTDVSPEAFSRYDRRFVRSVANVVASAIDRRRRERALETKNERLAALDQLSRVVRDINRELSGFSSREEIERVVCERLANASSYAFAWIGDVDDNGDVYVRTEAGVEGALDDRELTVDDGGLAAPAVEALRERSLAATQVVRTDAVADEWREHAERAGYRSSVAVPLAHEDETYGVLNLYADRPHAFDGRERRVVQQLGEIVGLAIALAERDRELAERERQYRTLAENVPNASVTMFDANGEYVTVAGTLFEDAVGVTDDDLVGRRPEDVDALPPETRTALGAANDDALAGERVEREVAVDGRTFFVRAIPTRDDGTITGGISLKQDVTERQERRRKLEHERERLEYVNRLLRHNLLNSLNVAHARTNLLEGHVDESVRGHLETASSRLDEMIDFVETMRSLMHILVGDDHECEPIALREVLETEVAKLEAAYDVTVRAEALPVVDVVADELLPEVFENLLVNAVQHNDADHRGVFVDVDVAATAGEATVYVADNGPGVPPEMRDGLVDKGEKGFDSPGTGFGLYLVRETVDADGDTVEVVDDDHAGATFGVTLPLAAEYVEDADDERP
jgi:PAS domain S-box-containing protein